MIKCKWLVKIVEFEAGSYRVGSSTCGAVGLNPWLMSCIANGAKYCPYCGKEIEVKDNDELVEYEIMSEVENWLNKKETHDD
ncbi:MAG: hypothetical protein SVK08_02440 [Halobacteriota archaeon]|nr:hypothetical protein [Halobacteriota archaeon]